MLTNKQIVIIGGDARQLEIIRKLLELGATISLIGFDQLDDGFIGTTKHDLTEATLKNADALLLPVSGTSSTGEVETIFSKEKIVLMEQHFSTTPPHCVIYSGISNDYLEQCAKRANRKLVKLLERDDIAIYNSIPTVEGTIMMAIQHTDITIHRSRVVVLGFGRVGVSIARSFAALGANVKVGARNSSHLARITEMGLEPFPIDTLTEHVFDADICINTIPAPIITKDVLTNMPTQTLIIDLASKPGGTDFDFAKKRGIKALLAPGLPGIVAPKTAGQILATVLAQLLVNDESS